MLSSQVGELTRLVKNYAINKERAIEVDEINLYDTNYFRVKCDEINCQIKELDNLFLARKKNPKYIVSQLKNLYLEVEKLQFNSISKEEHKILLSLFSKISRKIDEIKIFL